MTTLETKILEALMDAKNRLERYDFLCQEMHDKNMELAKKQTSDYWRKDYERRAKNDLASKKHGYSFITDWKNVISEVMYGRTYYEWHPAQAGRRKGSGHSAYITSELTKTEVENVNKVFNGLVNHGYLKISKSSKMAIFTK